MTRESECLHKVRYQTRKKAKTAIRRMFSRDHNGRLNAYPCSYCPWFHVGHVHPNARMHARQRIANGSRDDFLSQGD